MKSLAEIRRRIEMLRLKRDDYEVAHAMEIQLYKDALSPIAEGVENPAAIAKATLKASEVSFPRYTA